MRGLDRLARRLNALPGACGSAASRAALQSAAEARDMATGLAPVRSGRLRDSLRVEAAGGGAAVVSDCGYAPFVELGSRAAPPRPFLYPAARDAAPRYAELAAEAVRRALRQGG